LLLQSCSQPEKAALSCQVQYKDVSSNAKEDFVLVVDYKNQTITRYHNDDSWKLFNPNFSPNKLSFQNPSFANPGIPDPNSFTYIDRNTLKLSSTGMYPAFGICKKTNLPNLTGSGKQI
jgi:hypothetical protein